MKIFKKNALLLTVALILSSVAHAQKVSEMTTFQRIKSIALIAPAIKVSSKLTLTILRNVTPISILFGPAGTLVPTAASMMATLWCLKGLEHDKAYTWSEYIAGIAAGLGLTYVSLELLDSLLELYYS